MKQTLRIFLHCTAFPGSQFDMYSNLHVGVQHKKETVQEVSGDATQAVFEIPITVDPGENGRVSFGGPFVHGPAGDKFLYLVWSGTHFFMKANFRRAKIKLGHLTWPQIDEALKKNQPLHADLCLTDAKGGPVCASLKPDNIQWRQ